MTFNKFLDMIHLRGWKESGIPASILYRGSLKGAKKGKRKVK